MSSLNRHSQRVVHATAWLLIIFMSRVAVAQTPNLMVLEEQAVRDAATRAAPWVVRIETFGGLEAVGNRLVGTGPTTGVIIDEDGYILSSAINFVQLPSSILVTIDGERRVPAEMVARDEARMLVLLKVDVQQKLPVPEIAPRDGLEVGQWAIALGRTFEGELPNISAGIISATNRIWGKAIQTDAKISPANYGGPLVDVDGRLIGILVPLSPRAQSEMAGAEWYDSGIGFAVPVADLLPHLAEMKQGQDLKPGLLGVSIKGKDQYADPVELAAVAPKSPAYDAGMKAGDVIVEVDGQEIVRQTQLKHALGPKYSGDSVQVVVERGEEKKRESFTVTLVADIPPYAHAFLGVLPQREPVEEGVAVRYVYPGSGAAAAGVQTGDVVREIGGEPVTSREQVHDLMARFEPGETVAVKVARGDQLLDLEAELAALPTDVPEDLPVATAPEPERTDETPQGLVEIEIPEVANKCYAVVPTDYGMNIPQGLIVWLRAPGDAFDKDKLIEQWQEICNEHRLILLAPQPADAGRWVATEVDFIRSTIDDAIARFNIDPTRIVVFGDAAGGAIGYLVAFNHRDVVRGVAALEAAVPRRVAVPANEPTQRLAVYSIHRTDSKTADPIQEGETQLRDKKFPVTQVEVPAGDGPLSDEALGQLIRWIDTLDRI